MCSPCTTLWEVDTDVEYVVTDGLKLPNLLASEQHEIWDASMVVKPAQAVFDEEMVRPRDEKRPVGYIADRSHRGRD